MAPEHMPELAGLIAEALTANDPRTIGSRVSQFRQRFSKLEFVR